MKNKLKINTNVVILIIVFSTINVCASKYTKYPFTNMLETVYTDGGKHLLRIDYNYKGEFVVEEGTEVIGESAAEGCDKITNLIIPDSVTNIMKFAFLSCRSLTNVVFGSGVREIGEFAFWACWKLEHVELPDSLETIGERAFAGCTSLKGIKIGSGLRNLGEYAIRHRPSPSKPDFETVITISPSNQLFRVKNGELVRKKEDENE